MYIIGFDGGGTKTHCVIGDKNKNILAEGFGGPGNYNTVGLETTGKSIQKAYKEACKQLEEKHQIKISLDQVDKIIVGLAGADKPSDIKNLSKLCKTIFKDKHCTIYNDAWIGLRSGSEENYGVISICGTGAAHAGRDKAGNELIFRNIDFIRGNVGGGGDLLMSALHYAFRSNEETYMKSSLEEKIQDVFGVSSMDEVCHIIDSNQMTSEHYFKIPVEVFKAAKEGDEVSKMLIHKMGKTEGKFAGAIIRKLGLQDEEVPMVLIGSLFKTNYPVLIDAYMTEVHKEAPKAYPVIPSVAPALGAYYMGLDAI